MTSPATLNRRLSLTLLTLYGLGTTVGAGIYVLIGKVAGRAGMLTPFAFLTAALLAGITALAFAELSGRYPRSAGEAVYVHEAFRRRQLATVVGLLVVLAGLVSSATIINGFVGYLQALVALPDWLIIVAAVSLLGGAAAGVSCSPSASRHC